MATDHNFKVKNGLDVLGGKASIAASTSTSSSNALKLHVGTINNTGSSAIAQFGGFIRASEYYILHESTGSGNSIFIDYVGNDLDVRAGEGSYTGVIRTNGYKVGTTTVIDSSRNIMGAGINSTANYTELGTTTASNLVFKRTNASYIQADGSGGYFIFITNGRSTSYANRALALTTDNNAEFGGAINTVGNVTVGGNLTVNGTTTTLNTATLQVEDKNIVLNYASGDTSSTADGAGITIQDAVNSSTDATILWDATNDRFNFSHRINVAGNLSAYHIYGQDHYVLNAAADGWHRWAQRSGGKVNLDVNTISGSSITASSGMVVTDISSTGRGIYRNNAGYDLRVGGGTNSNTGAYISISGETRGGSNSAYNGRIEYYSGGTGFANQAAILGDHVWYAKHAGGSAHLMTLDSATGHLNLKLGGFYLNGTTVIDSSRNFYAVGMTTTSGVTIGGGLTTGTINVNSQDSTNEGGEIVLKGAGSNEDVYIDNRVGNFRVFDGSSPQVRLSLNTDGNATFAGTISSGAITSSGTITSDQFTSASGDVTFRRGGSSTARILIESGNTTSGQNFIVNGTIRTHDGSPSLPTYTFSTDTDTGMYRNSADIVAFATGGARRGYFASSGIHSDTNVYTGTSSDFRNYGGVWRASTGLTGNGFSFINSVDGTAMTLSSTGDMTVTNHVAINNFTLSADVALGVRGHGTGTSQYTFSAQDSGGNTKFYVRDDGVVAVQGSQYLYAASTGTGFYVQNGAVFRGNISNDTGDLTLADHVNITSSGTLKIAGTQVISSSRALTNIASINATGAIETTSQLASYQGNVSNSFANTSIRLGYSGSASYQQAIKSRHNSGTGAGNAIDFFLWDSGTDAVGDIGTLRVASFETSKGLDIVDGGLQIDGTTVVTSLRNLTNVGTISSGSITAGNSSTAASLRAHYNDGSYMTLVGYGLEMNRGASYIRPTTDGDKTLYIGGADASLDWNAIHFRSVNGLYMTGTRFIDTSRNLSNIGTISSGAITSTGRSTFDSVTIDDDGSNSPLLRVVADDHGPWAFQLENASASNSGLFQAYVNNNNDLYFRAKETGAYPTWYFQISNGTNHVNSLYLNSSGINSAGHVNGASFKVSTTTVINSSRELTNVTLNGSTGGARFQNNIWINDVDNDGRLYFAANGLTYYKSTSGHRFRANGDVTRLTIDADGRVNLYSGGDTNAPGGAALAVAGTSVITTSRVLENVTIGSGVTANTSSSIAPAIRGTVAGVDNTGYVHAFKVDGGNLSSQIRFTVGGTVGSVVFSNDVSVVCNHYRDILIESTSGFYTILTVKVVSNGNEDFSVFFKSNSANTATVNIVVFPLNDEVVTITTTDPSYSGRTLEHTCDYGKKFSATNNATPDQFDITTDGDIDANKYQISGTTVIGADRTVRAANGSVSSPTISFSADTDTGLYRYGTNQLGFVTAGAYRGMFDNSGNFIVGGTSNVPGAGNAATGVSLYNDGRIFAAKDGNTVMSLNRNSSNGVIAEFRYGGNLIGNMGVEGGDSFFIQSDGTGGGGLRFHNSGRISPVRNGALINNTIDLGASTQQFASLYLGTGLYMGGSNILDASRNLNNIGTITASGTVNLSGALLSTNAGANAIKTRFISGAASSSTSDGNLYVQHGKTNNILCFNSTSGNPQFQIYGNDNGTQRSGTLKIGTDGSFNITASDTYLILGAGSYVQSSKPHNFTQGILFDGTSVINDSRQLANVTVTSAEAESGQSLNGNFGQWQSHSTYNSGFNTDVSYWGWNYVQTNTNAPHTASSQWYRNRVSLGSGYGHGIQSGDYWLEMAYPRYGSGSTPGHMYIRTCENGTIGSWYEVGAHLRGNLNVGTSTSADINLGSDTTNARLIIRKDDNNVADHIKIFCDGTQTGEIGSQDTTWLRINQTVNKNIYTPRYIRADSGLFVDGASMGIDGSGRIRAFAGSTSSVGIGFATDINTGLFLNNADNIGFVTNGTNRVNLSNTKLALLAGLGLDLETSSGNVRGLIAAFETAPHLRIATSNAESIGFYDGGTSGTQNVNISGSGALTVRDNVTAYGSFSDIRLKENIEAIPDAIQKVQKLEGVTFNYKKDGSRSTGLIAQQLQEVLPEVVYETEDLDTEETHYAVRYGNVVGLLVEAIKEQQTQLTAQQEQINQLTNLVNTLMEK